MTGQFLSMAQLKKFVRNADSFDDFLQHVANYAIERFASIGQNPPMDRVEALLNVLIESGFETRHFDKVRPAFQCATCGTDDSLTHRMRDHQ